MSRLALGLLLLGALVCPALADVSMIFDDARFPSPVAITGTSAYFLWHRSQAQSYSNGKTMTNYESTRDAPFTMKTLDDGFFVCADANLTDPRKPRATHLGFVLVDRTGIVFAIVPVESTYRNRAFNWAHSDTLCRIFARPSEGNALISTPPGGSPTEVGRIVAIPLSEDFWDGSSWTSTAVPLLGQPLPAP